MGNQKWGDLNPHPVSLCGDQDAVLPTPHLQGSPPGAASGGLGCHPSLLPRPEPQAQLWTSPQPPPSANKRRASGVEACGQNSPTPGARGVTQGAEGKGQAQRRGQKGKASICSSTWLCSLAALGLSLPLGKMGVAPSTDRGRTGNWPVNLPLWGPGGSGGGGGAWREWRETPEVPARQ